MFLELADKVGRVIGPVLIHYLVINIISMMRLHADAAFLTSIAAVLVLPLFWQMYKKDKELTGNGRRTPEMAALDYVKIAVLGIVCNLLLTLVMNWILSFFSFSNQTQEALFGSNLAVQLVGVGMIVPIMEEVLFRGIVYNRLKGYTKTAQSAMILAAAIFAVYHGNVVQMLFAFPMALILIAVYEKWGTLRACITFHMAVNLSSVILTAVLSSR